MGLNTKYAPGAAPGAPTPRAPPTGDSKISWLESVGGGRREGGRMIKVKRRDVGNVRQCGTML